MLPFILALLFATPFQGDHEQAIGFYSKGSLTQPDSLENEGSGFVKIFQPRDRRYATYDLLTVLRTVAAEMHSEFPEIERLQVGDIAAKTGGEISGHASHQNGLDVDVVFLRNDHREMPTQTTNGFDEIFVKNQKVTSNFNTAANFTLFELFVATSRVNRIFMDPVIKKTFCEYAAKNGTLEKYQEVLRRMRPLANHQDHFHLRLTCPDKSPKCETQDEPPAGDGCNDLTDMTESFQDDFENELE